MTRFAYDAQGNVTATTDAAGNVRAFTYEPTFNRVTSITDQLNNVTQFAYDTNGNLPAITDSTNAGGHRRDDSRPGRGADRSASRGHTEPALAPLWHRAAIPSPDGPAHPGRVRDSELGRVSPERRCGK